MQSIKELLIKEEFITFPEDSNIINAERAFFGYRAVAWIREKAIEPKFDLHAYLVALTYYKLGMADLKLEDGELLYRYNGHKRTGDAIDELSENNSQPLGEFHRPDEIAHYQKKAPLEKLINTRNLRSLMNKEGYTFFDGNKKFNLNLIGIRRDNDGTNKFDDFMVVLYKSEGLKEVCKIYPITTDPGEHWLKHPINPKGTAVLVPGQYRGTWKLGKHQNNYEALVQRKPVKVWRDNNKDEVIDYQQLKLVNEGYFGINIHRSNPYTQSYLVNRWSAGCQVFQKIEDYKEFMELCKNSSALYGNSFSYTLVTEQELRKHTDKWLFILNLS